MYLVFLSPYLVASSLSFVRFLLIPQRVRTFTLSFRQPCLPVRASGPGGDDGNRTHDPLLAGQVLSQLSYTPVCLYPILLPFQ